MYNQRIYEFCVLETKLGSAVSIIECDINVEFAPSVGYKEPERTKKPDEEMAVDPAELMPEPTGFVAFHGKGNKLNGKKKEDISTGSKTAVKVAYRRGVQITITNLEP
jgi:ubiquitin fusion degradation protein 1